MKNYLKTGLLALTIAFGIVSCDKNGLDDIEASDVGVVVNDEYSKITFGENGAGIVIPKLKGSTESAAKSAGEFTHIYASTSSQTLSIFNAAEVEVYSGSYPANMISSINPASIILANADGYSAVSSNEANGSTDVVLDFLPYTSEVDFNLSASTRIALEATLERGFLIVNAEQEAADGNRVVGATASGAPLLRDTDGDFYGYLLAGEHDIVVTYALNGVSTLIETTEIIALGTAYTINVVFANEPIAVIGSDVSTSTRTALESAIGSEAAGRDINEDGDFLDNLERVVTSTTPTSDDVATGPAVITEAPWYVISDVDLSSSPEASTEKLQNEDVNLDGDKYDMISRTIAITTTTVDGEATVVNAPGAWSVNADGDYSSVFVDENNNGVNDADEIPAENGVDTYTYSVWSPATLAADVATINQTRTATLVPVDAVDDPAPATLALEQTIDNPNYLADEADEYTSVSTPITTGGDETTIDAGDAVVTFLYGGSSYTSLELAQDAADADSAAAGTTVTIVMSSSQGRSIETTAIVVTTTTVYSVQINVREDVPALPAKDDLVVPVTTPSSSVATDAVVTPSNVSYDVAANDAPIVDAWFNAAGDALDNSLANQGIITNATYPTKGYELVITVDPAGVLNDIATIKFYVDGDVTNELAGSASNYAANHTYAQGEIVNGNQ